jgi:PAS domain S-box-containing protein
MQQPLPLFASVLLLEDEPAHALLIERALKGLVQKVVTCGTVRAALEELPRGAFDLVVSDLNLPDLRSDAVVSALREQASKVPLLVLTSSATVSDGVSAMRSGANDFLVKNFDATFRDVLQLSLSRLKDSLRSEQLREQLTRDRDLLREALENSGDGLAVVNSDGAVRYCNSSFERFLAVFKASSRNVLSINPSEVERGAEVLATLGQRFASHEPGSVWTTEIAQRSEGEWAFDLSVSGVKGATSEPTCVVWTRDVRERKKREQFQREILSTTTHDLKGPLGAISVSCDVLLGKEGADDRTYALVERISSSAHSAIHLIEEFLSLRRIEEGTFILRPVAYDIVRTVKKVAEQYRLEAKNKGVTLRVECEAPELSGCVDPLGLERVLSNLVSNGIKFTPRNGDISMSLRRVHDGVVLTVKDSGCGMEPADAQRLFTRYGRLQQHEGVAGTGLGLFIVKCIVSAHGGVIDVVSSPGKGTMFSVFLPDSPPRNDRGEVVCLDFA